MLHLPLLSASSSSAPVTMHVATWPPQPPLARLTDSNSTLKTSLLPPLTISAGKSMYFHKQKELETHKTLPWLQVGHQLVQQQHALHLRGGGGSLPLQPALATTPTATHAAVTAQPACTPNM